ncbi:MAG: hypothetical protein HYX94_04855 [Chloroflexi bacterium]|nr:hypothetical protein [Chloroflexota bacterium]
MRRTLVVVSHTHWDREWHQTFQQTRLRLVRLLDSLLDLLSTDSGYRHFTCDGQTVMLEDYVEVRSERREEIGRLVREGKLIIGPWYVLADEFLPDGESLIRNLILGRQQMAAFGAPPHGIGYLPDAFGHIAQMPQILRRFGLDAAVLWRGVPEQVGKSEFVWRAPDGSEVLTVHMPGGYANAHGLPNREEALLGRLAAIRSQLEARATTEHLLLMNGNDHAEPQAELPALLALANDRLADAELVHGTLPMYVSSVRASLNGTSDLLPRMQGELRSVRNAHLLQGVLSTRMWVKQQNRSCETILTRWAEPFTAIACLVAKNKRAAENQDTAKSVPIPSTLYPLPSTLSLLRQAWKYLLQNQAHDSACGCSVDAVYEDVKARFNWSSQISEELTSRALGEIAANVRLTDLPALAGHRSCRDESRLEDHRSVEYPHPSPLPLRQEREQDGPPLSSTVPLSGIDDSTEGRLAFVLFNAESGPRTDFVSLRTKAPLDAGDIVLADDEARPLPYQILAQHSSELISTDVSRADLEGFLCMVGGGDLTSWPEEKIDSLEALLALTVADRFPQLVITGVEVRPSLVPGTVIIQIGTAERGGHSYEAIAEGLHQVAALVMRGDVDYFQLRMSRRDEVELGFVATAVPGYGYRTYQILPGHRARPETPAPGEGYAIQNEHFLVQASPTDGTLTVIDRETGSVYEKLNQFVDGGDAGDEYNYCPPAEDRLIGLPVSPPAVTVVESGPARSTLRVDKVLMLPRSLAAGRQQRSAELVACPISSFVSLYAGVRRIDVRTVVDNVAEDHRLRAHFPTRIVANHTVADHSFAVVERPIQPAEGAAPVQGNGFEQALGTYPHHTFVDVGDGELGFMLASRGLPEYEALPSPHGATLALTLLRCVGWLSRDDLTTRQGNAGPSLPTPGAQCPGRHEFHYSLIPHEFGWSFCERTVQQAHWFANPLRAVEATGATGNLDPNLSFVDLEPAGLHLTCLKSAESGDGIVVRFFNPSPNEEQARVRVNLPVQTAEVVSLGEERLGELEPDPDGRWSLPVGPHEIVTLKLVT